MLTLVKRANWLSRPAALPSDIIQNALPDLLGALRRLLAEGAGMTSSKLNKTNLAENSAHVLLERPSWTHAGIV